jgi:hypothetical protein
MLPLMGIRWRDGSGKQRQDSGEDKLGCSFHVHLRYSPHATRYQN